MKNIIYIIFLFLIIFAFIGPFFLPYDPFEMDLDRALESPSMSHIFGTDNEGRDILSRVIYGSRLSIGIGLAAAVISVLIGLVVGLIAGYGGRSLDRFLCIIIDITLAFPSLLLAIGITIVLPRGFWSVIIALSLVGWAGFARFTRGVVLNIKNNNYIEAAYSMGVKPFGIMFKHILPNCIPLVIVTGFLSLGTFILSEASLSFLGLGVPPPTPTWGGMINYGREFIQTAPWIVIFPGLILAVTVILCNMIGDHIRDRMDPRNKKLLNQ